MKEVVFIRQNIDKWRAAERLAEDAVHAAPDDLADAYIDVTSDLSFSQTHYEHSRITSYLNALASALHNEIYRNKRERWNRIVTFWTQEVPDAMWQERRALLVSLLVFLLGVLIGSFSQMLDADFARVVMGDEYVNMTLDNISNGTPMAVYESENSGLMFIGITHNNIRVSFLAFAMGVLTSVASSYIIFTNGIMVGCFDMFFVQHNLFYESALAVWLHGTLEISSIIVAGGAGITMGNALLFPGTYSRIQSLRRGARRGLRIAVGTAPLFVVAGFIESYLTRHVEWPDIVRLSIIFLSASFVLFYFVYLPYRRNHGTEKLSTLQGTYV